MGCVHGSSNGILSEWDPGPTYVVQRLWDPGGPSYTSRSRAKKLPRLYPPTSIIIPTIPSHPSAESSFQTPPREARPYGELQIPTYTTPIGLDSYLETVMTTTTVYLS